MASYDVAIWLRSETRWPEIVLLVQAETPIDAVLRTRHVRHAAKIAVNTGQGSIQRWYEVTTLVDGFDYQREEVTAYGF